jgi:Virulence-associated protein E
MAQMLEPDRNQIEMFVNAVFRHAKKGFVSLRAFIEGSNTSFRISPVPTTATDFFKFLCNVAEDDARRAANEPSPVVFCPPLATFANAQKAREEDLIQGLALSVECDENPAAAYARLEPLLGPATVIVRSGGIWMSNGGAHDKLHLHWRLAVPAESGDLIKLKRARLITAHIVGADTSNVPICHCIRWPGSWHRKAQPRPCEIVLVDPNREIVLADALAALEPLAPSPSSSIGSNGTALPGGEWHTLTGQILEGKDLHQSIARLAMKLLIGGTPEVMAVQMLRAWLEQSQAKALRFDEWQDRYDDVPRAVSSAGKKLARKPAAQATQPSAQPQTGPAQAPQPQPAPSPPPPPPPPPPPGIGPTPAAGSSPSPGQTPAKQAYMKSKGAWACNVGNVLLALEQEPELVGAFGYDQMLWCDVLLRPLFTSDPHFVPRPVTDADVLAVQRFLQWLGFRRLGKNTTHDAIIKHAHDYAFHPVRNYLDRLIWDREERLQTWLVNGFGADPGAYSEAIGRMFLISMVARIYQPGCKVDHMPVLEGEQGLLKSSACNVLAGGYFSDQLPDITSKEAFQHLRGKWLIEVAELHTYSRAAIDHFKAFLVREVERYRPPWGHKETHEPRQCVFVGTTNKSMYLKDVTGNRRFWPIRTGKIKLDWLRDNRDQLFAEAVHLYHGDTHWWPDQDFERQTIRDEQEARYEPDAWEEPIQRYLDGLSPKKTTVIEIAVGALAYEAEPPVVIPYQTHPARGTPINRLTPNDQNRITAILIHLGWTPKRTKTGRWWEHT